MTVHVPPEQTGVGFELTAFAGAVEETAVTKEKETAVTKESSGATISQVEVLAIRSRLNVR